MDNQRVVSQVVSQEEWLAASKEHLSKEKEFTRLRDELSKRRRELPRMRVEKDYLFDGPTGKENLSELFAGRSQLIIYHFMFAPSWDEGCPICSFFADSYAGFIVHLGHRDATMVTVSRAPLEKIEAYKARMAWDFKWVSSFESNFNNDHKVTFTEEEIKNGGLNYNFGTSEAHSPESHGISVFYKDDDGNIFHTYSSYARGVDILMGAYNFLDLLPKGRDEDGLDFTMAWVRRHDEYQ